jgi:hypothetical protein
LTFYTYQSGLNFTTDIKSSITALSSYIAGIEFS